MREITNLNDAVRALTEFVPSSRSTSPYTLDRMRALLAFFGNPQDKLRIIHVAGTSGKTSTSYYTAALLHVIGQKVGLTVSPHVVAVNDRVQINLLPLPEAEFCRDLGEFLKHIKSSGITPSYFELLVALAYWEFARQEVNYAVVEVGLGGLVDGTNVVNRADKVCIITDIGLDHVNVLGHTLAEIASQKAGIIQPHNAVFVHRQADEVLDVIQKVCERQAATLHIIEPQEISAELSFLPLFQQRNFTLAQAAANYVIERDHLPELKPSQMIRAAQTNIPARMEVFHHDEKTIILDGAHNPQKLHALIESIRAQFSDQPVAAVISFAAGDEYRLAGALQEITRLCQHIIITSFSGKQDEPKSSIKTEILAKLLDQQDFHNYEIIAEPEQAFTTLLARPEPLLLTTGSFYLLNHIRPLMLEAV